MDGHGPIGMFDSGVGGLTVLGRIAAQLPDEPIFYIADQAHVPYGGRPLSEIRELATNLSNTLFDHGCKALVMACNISSATTLESVASAYPKRPVLGMIDPGAAAAAVATDNGRIGVLATAGTVASRAYPETFARMDCTLHVAQVACPQFVPLVERGATDGPEAEAACRLYLAPLLAERVDTIVLGCTHYPYLLPMLQRCAPGVKFIDPAVYVTRQLATQLGRRGTRATGPRGPHRLFTTGDVSRFSEQLSTMLPDVDYVAAHLELSMAPRAAAC
ncbi:MAG: glutamate racemase [Deltaproteobacteria bacterium]